jgi:hypothetical protein
LIIYRKGAPLRIRRTQWPSPPWWSATTIAPYAARRATPIAIDYLELRASHAERLESGVADDVASELERAELRNAFDAPVLIDAAEFSEVVFRRGADALRYCGAHGLAATLLLSVRGALPPELPAGTSVVVSVWPLDFARLEQLCSEVSREGMVWGLAIPVLYPVTTELDTLRDIVELARRHGATFVGSISIDIDQSVKGAIA